LPHVVIHVEAWSARAECSATRFDGSEGDRGATVLFRDRRGRRQRPNNNEYRRFVGLCASTVFSSTTWYLRVQGKPWLRLELSPSFLRPQWREEAELTA